MTVAEVKSNTHSRMTMLRFGFSSQIKKKKTILKRVTHLASMNLEDDTLLTDVIMVSVLATNP